MSTYEISKSSLLSLKAELLKKHEELHRVKAENKIKLQKEHKKTFDLKNKRVDERALKDGDEEDEDLLQKSKISLHAKSQLYEKLLKDSQNNVENPTGRQYLVQFDKKSETICTPNNDNEYQQADCKSNIHSDDEYKSENSDDDDWVEFIDKFGRTRTCLKEDLELFREKDKDIKVQLPSDEEDGEANKECSTSMPSTENDELDSGEMRRDVLRQNWEKEAEKLRDKSDIHYQDILFNEARTHGVGYYGFAKDEATRSMQQDALKNLRRETEAQQKAAQTVRVNRERQLAARIHAAKNRKRAREGLPALAFDDNAEKQAEEEATKKIGENAESVPDNNSENEERVLLRKTHLRPWDVGKKGVVSSQISTGSRDPYSQEEWNDLQRSKRDKEFAPPEMYHSKNMSRKRVEQDLDRRSTTNPYKSSTPLYNDSSSSEEDGGKFKAHSQSWITRNEPPPATCNVPSDVNAKRHKGDINVEDSIMQGLRYMREQIERHQDNSDS